MSPIHLYRAVLIKLRGLAQYHQRIDKIGAGVNVCVFSSTATLWWWDIELSCVIVCVFNFEFQIPNGRLKRGGVICRSLKNLYSSRATK